MKKYNVERAIILAAGFGQRLNPVTLTTPKPLVKVNGIRIIDTIIDALLYNGIKEIHVVVGYLKDRFVELKEKYSFIDIIDNPYYDKCNNIASLYVAREHLKNTVVLDGDLMIYNKEVFQTEFDKSGYNVIWSEKETNEWLLEVENNTVTKCTIGGSKGWQLFGISYWNEVDGKVLAKRAEELFADSKNHKLFWDNIALTCYPKDFKLTIYPMNYGDIFEIDNLFELQEIDSSYKNL